MLVGVVPANFRMTAASSGAICTVVCPCAGTLTSPPIGSVRSVSGRVVPESSTADSFRTGAYGRGLGFVISRVWSMFPTRAVCHGDRQVVLKSGHASNR